MRPDSKLLRVLSVSNRSSFYVLNAKLRTSKRKKDSLQKKSDLLKGLGRKNTGFPP